MLDHSGKGIDFPKKSAKKKEKSNVLGFFSAASVGRWRALRLSSKRLHDSGVLLLHLFGFCLIPSLPASGLETLCDAVSIIERIRCRCRFDASLSLTGESKLNGQLQALFTDTTCSIVVSRPASSSADCGPGVWYYVQATVHSSGWLPSNNAWDHQNFST